MQYRLKRTLHCQLLLLSSDHVGNYQPKPTDNQAFSLNIRIKCGICKSVLNSTFTCSFEYSYLFLKFVYVNIIYTYTNEPS